MRKRYAAQYKFERFDNLNGLIDSNEPGAAKAKRKLADSWTKRQSNNTTGFYDPKKAKKAKQ